ncbi:Phosphate metabolism transcription protein [Collariella sp. IMI 366227]|nr:Phosphate metabolism transcription protein [Collariella sp. IMI 366227]
MSMQPTFLPGAELSAERPEEDHRQLLVRAITRILHIELAEMTYAQIIDGLPIGDVAWDAYYHPYRGHPIIVDAHEDLFHQIGAILYKIDTSLHKNDGITEWTPPKPGRFYEKWYPNGPLPSLFHHKWYVNHDQYSRHIANMVGYWAEARIPGGVVLFDRRNPDAEPSADPDAIYFHSNRQHITYRIYQLLPAQRKALLNFLIADEPPVGEPALNPGRK